MRTLAPMITMTLLSLVPGCNGIPRSSRTAKSAATPCACPPATPCTRPAAAPPQPTPRYPSVTTRRALFNDLVKAARRYHVFSEHTEKNLGRRWEDDLPGLERTFVAAEQRHQLTAALHWFVCSLHDRHLRYVPAERPRPLTAGVEFEVEWRSGRPQFYVASVSDEALRSKVTPGDLVEAAEGIPVAELLTRHALLSSANHWRGVATDVARHLGQRATVITSTRPGEAITWTLRPRSGGSARTVTSTWRVPPPGPERSDLGIALGTRPCAGVPEADYGPYTVAAEGHNFCLYTAKAAPHRAYPIVRFFSFMYAGRVSAQVMKAQLRAEHRRLQEALARVKGARGVILDLRHNRGGNNPNWFLDWWAPAPYIDILVQLRLAADIDDRTQLLRAGLAGDRARDYLVDLRARKPGQTFGKPRTFRCREGRCDWDNRYTPAHQVTRLPVALLVGPGCVSSCDQLVRTFEENRFGPLIGMPVSAAFTTFRLRYDVRIPGDPTDLGWVPFAFSRDVSGRTGAAIEGLPRHLDYPVDRTFENRSRYERLLVDTAIRSFHSYPFPKAGVATENRSTP